MISFYPGPSRVHEETPKYVKDAYEQGILSINHRSEAFMKISEKVVGLLKKKLKIPKDYTILYTSSATECWEVIAQSVITGSSNHLFNGAFGKKWYEYTRRLVRGAKGFSFDQEDLIDPGQLKVLKEDSVICLTQNETSNGTQVSNTLIRSLRREHPGNLIAVDATSSMAGIYLDFRAADIWFASVQKCFGLPAGLGLMICSPAAVERTRKKGEKSHYNSLTFMLEMMEKWQTPFTPNVLNIYLLGRVLEASKSIEEVHSKIESRYRLWIDFFSEKQSMQHLITNRAAHSFTVIPVTARETLISSIKSHARKKGFLLGEGYGDLKPTTFRIANFPAIKKNEINSLKEFLSTYD